LYHLGAAPIPQRDQINLPRGRFSRSDASQPGNDNDDDNNNNNNDDDDDDEQDDSSVFKMGIE
jgi:hypothetical protein